MCVTVAVTRGAVSLNVNSHDGSFISEVKLLSGRAVPSSVSLLSLHVELVIHGESCVACIFKFGLNYFGNLLPKAALLF